MNQAPTTSLTFQLMPMPSLVPVSLPPDAEDLTSTPSIQEGSQNSLVGEVSSSGFATTLVAPQPPTRHASAPLAGNTQQTNEPESASTGSQHSSAGPSHISLFDAGRSENHLIVAASDDLAASTASASSILEITPGFSSAGTGFNEPSFAVANLVESAPLEAASAETAFAGAGSLNQSPTGPSAPASTTSDRATESGGDSSVVSDSPDMTGPSAVLSTIGDSAAELFPPNPSRTDEPSAKQPSLRTPAVIAATQPDAATVPNSSGTARSARNVSPAPVASQAFENAESSVSSAPPSVFVDGFLGVSLPPIPSHESANASSGTSANPDRTPEKNGAAGNVTSGAFSQVSSEHSGTAKPITAISSTDTSGGTPDQSSQTNPPANQATSNPPPFPQPAPVASANPAAQTFVLPVAANPGTPHRADNIAPSAAPDAKAILPDPAEAPVNVGPVQTAQIVNRAAQSEMRIELNTSAFGNVEVHTIVHANEVGLSIGSEKGDLRSLLSNELPAIANTLQQQSLRLNPVNFLSGFVFPNPSSGGDSQPRSFHQPGVAVSVRNTSDREMNSPTETSEARYRGSGRLSVLA